MPQTAEAECQIQVPASEEPVSLPEMAEAERPIPEPPGEEAVSMPEAVEATLPIPVPAMTDVPQPPVATPKRESSVSPLRKLNLLLELISLVNNVWSLFRKNRIATVVIVTFSFFICEHSANWLALRFMVGPRIATTVVNTWSKQFEADIAIGSWHMDVSEQLLTLADVRVRVDNTIREREIFEADAIHLQGALRYPLVSFFTLKPLRDVIHDLFSPGEPARFAWSVQAIELDNPRIRIDQGLAGDNNLLGILRDTVSIDARARTTNRARYAVGFFLERALRRPDALEIDEGQLFQVPLIRADNLELEWSQEKNVLAEPGLYTTATETRALSSATLVLQDFYWPMEDENLATELEFKGRYGGGTVTMRGDANFLTDPPRIHAFVNLNNVSAAAVLWAMPPGDVATTSGAISGQFEIVYELGTLTGDGTMDFVDVELLDIRAGQRLHLRESTRVSFRYRAETSRSGFFEHVGREALVNVLAPGELRDQLIDGPSTRELALRESRAETQEVREIDPARVDQANVDQARVDLVDSTSEGAGGAVTSAARGLVGENMAGAVGGATDAILADSMSVGAEPSSRITEAPAPRAKKGGLFKRIGGSMSRLVKGEAKLTAEMQAREKVESGAFGCDWRHGPIAQIDDSLRLENLRKCDSYNYRVAAQEESLYLVLCDKGDRLFVLDAQVPHAAAVKQKGLKDACS